MRRKERTRRRRRTFKGHVLDEADGDVALARELDKVPHFGIVDPPDDDNVDLCPEPWESLGDVERVHDGVEASPSRHELVLEGVERVEREVEVGQAGGDELREFALEGDAVRGQSAGWITSPPAQSRR